MATALRNIILIPNAQKPQLNIGELEGKLQYPAHMPKVRDSNGTLMPFETTKLLSGIARALVDARLSQKAKNPTDEKVVDRAITITNDVISKIVGKSVVPSDELGDTVEEVIAEHHEHLAAKAFILYRVIKGAQKHRVKTLHVIRRNDQVVRWIPEKIELAIRKAFIALKQDSDPAEVITEDVVEKIKNLGVTEIHIELIQDIVINTLSEKGYLDVATGYQEYRAQRSLDREAQIRATKSINPELITEDLVKRIEFAASSLDLPISKEEVAKILIGSSNPKFSIEESRTATILNAKVLVEQDPAFAYFAARILLSYIYEEVLDWKVTDGITKLKEAHKAAFLKYIPYGIEIGRLSPKLSKFNLEFLAEALDPIADLNFDILGMQTLYDRYLIHENKKRIETPQMFWMRVAMGLAVAETNKDTMAVNFYELYRSKRFCSSTPTLFNAGTAHSQLSSCYLYKIDDTIESILIRGIAENGFLSKWAGGLGGSWTAVRGSGGYIKGTNGESQGVIPFLKLHNDQLIAVNQGGKRRGSGCAYLETWHNDIEEFLQLRINTGDDRRRTHDMNTANWIPDLFMQRIEEGGSWTLFRSNEVPDLHEIYGSKFKERYEHYEALAKEGKIYGKTMTARSLWAQMIKAIFETGHPWMTFKDPCNVRSPQDHVGVIHSSNLCTEITLNTSAEETAVCNLGSINLNEHVSEDGEVNWDMLKDTIRVAVRMLDNVIDINFYPTEPARLSNSRHRPIGLGLMGLQDALHKKNIPFASQENVEFNDEIMEFIAYHAYLTSSRLAKERGQYSSYKGSKWDRGILPHDTIELLEKERGQTTGLPYGGSMDWTEVYNSIKENGMRNSNVIAIAPTATISNIMGCMECIQPDYKHLFTKSNLSGDFIWINAHLVKKLKENNLWDEEMRNDLKYFDGELKAIDRIPAEIKHQFSTVFELPQEWLIEAAARRGKWIDQAQSLNLFLTAPNPKNLSDIYRHAWSIGLKTTYYLRSRSASNIEKATQEVRTERVMVTSDEPCESCQ